MIVQSLLLVVIKILRVIIAIVIILKPAPNISYWNSIGVPRLGSMPDISFLPDAVLIENHYTILELNTTAVKMFGYNNRDELIGKSINILVPLTYASVHSTQVASVFGNMRNRAMGSRRQVKGLRADKTEFEVSIQLCPATIQVSGFTHYERIVTCVCRDITEHNLALTGRMEADKRNDAMEKFLRLINHEVRTSIHAITNALATVKTDLQSYLLYNTDLTLNNSRSLNSNAKPIEALDIPSMLEQYLPIVDDDLKELQNQPNISNTNHENKKVTKHYNE